MENLIVAAVLLLLIGAAIAYIVKEKKRGVRCIGCPAGGVCGKNHAGASGCSGCTGNCSGCGCHADAEK